MCFHPRQVDDGFKAGRQPLCRTDLGRARNLGCRRLKTTGLYIRLLLPYHGPRIESRLAASFIHTHISHSPSRFPNLPLAFSEIAATTYVPMATAQPKITLHW